MKRFPLWLLSAVGIVCLILFLSLNYTSRMGPSGRQQEVQIGFTGSPWLTWGHAEGQPPAGPPGSVPPGIRLNLLSWSALAGLIGTASLVALGRLRRAEARRGSPAGTRPRR